MNEELSGSASKWQNGLNNGLGVFGGLLSGAAELAGSLRSPRFEEKRSQPAQQPIHKNTLLLIGGAIVTVLALVFLLRK